MATLFTSVLFVLLIVIYGVYVYLKNRKFWYLVGKIKGPKSLPFIGNAHQLGTTSEDILRNTFKIYQNTNYSSFRLIIGNNVLVMLCEPEHVQVVLSNNEEITKTDDYDFMTDWLGHGLLIATGNKWRRQRKIITPAFHFKILEQFVDVFHRPLDILIEKLEQNKGKVFNVFPLVNLYALDVISETVMGVNLNAQENSNSEYVKAVHRICAIYNKRTYSPFKRNNFIYSFTSDCREEKKMIKILHAATKEVIQKRKLQLKEEIDNFFNDKVSTENDEMLGTKKTKAFLDLLLLTKNLDGGPLSDESIREEVDTFMFAGHDTTTSALCFSIYCLANNPDVQHLAYEEQMTIFGGDMQRKANYEDLLRMKYLGMVMKETQRLYPAVALFGRKLTKDLKLDDSITLPGTSLAVIHQFCMNRNPKYYPDPEKFNPERFQTENIKGKHPFAFVPFSAGPRNCIGQKFATLSIKNTLSKILRSFELCSAGPGTEPRLASDIILTSVNGILIQLKDRSV